MLGSGYGGEGIDDFSKMTLKFVKVKGKTRSRDYYCHLQ